MPDDLIVCFMTEGFTDDGERDGYLDLFDPVKGETIDPPDDDATLFDGMAPFITEGEARALAARRGWRILVQ